MTLGQLDYVLFRPWLPVEQYLYLPVSEFLAAWEKSRGSTGRSDRRPALGGLLPRAADIPGQGRIPFGFYRTTRRTAGACSSRPARTAAACRWCCSAAAWSWSTRPRRAHPGPRPAPSPAGGGCDVLIVGAGPAGLAAAVYAASRASRPGAGAGRPRSPAGTSSLRFYLGSPTA